ncbi:hypothetical protein BJ165DRAFT_1522017 [Panaeolus papilionaceus]|nr:hypothetical protein BJ165DRAFT_1522017 [Panaeolus papilionaceus]
MQIAVNAPPFLSTEKLLDLTRRQYVKSPAVLDSPGDTVGHPISSRTLGMDSVDYHHLVTLSASPVSTTPTPAQASESAPRLHDGGETTSTSTVMSVLATPSSRRHTTAEITPSQTHGDSMDQMDHKHNGHNTGSPNVSCLRQQSRSSQALILGLAIPFAILLFGLMVGLAILLYRRSRRKNDVKRASSQSMFSGDPEDKNGDFWASSNDRSSPHSSQLAFTESGGFARNGNERQMKFVDTSTQWGKHLSSPEQGFRGQSINPNFALTPLRKPPSIVTFPAPADIPTPSEITAPKSFVKPGHSHQPSQAFSETDSTLSYVSYKDDVAYNQAPVTSHYSSMAKPSPTATRLNMYRFPTRSSTSSIVPITGGNTGLKGSEKDHNI